MENAITLYMSIKIPIEHKHDTILFGVACPDIELTMKLSCISNLINFHFNETKSESKT